jgi:hypothetical protein
MAERGQPKALDDDKQHTICQLVAAGVTLRQAAGFVDCDPKTIRREAQRNDDFRRRLAKAKSEAAVPPLQTLRQAAKSNWRAALSLMDRLEPNQFARQNTKIITQREANQFAADLVASIERAVSDADERKDLFELLSTAMPPAMRRRWDGQGMRRALSDAMHDLDAKRMERQERCAKRHRDLLAQISHYLPWELLPVVAAHVLDVPITPDDEIAWGLSGHKEASESAPRDGGTNNLTASSRAENTVPPPGPYSDPLPRAATC